MFHDIAGTQDGFIVLGYTESFGPPGVYLVKIDRDGRTLWEKTYAEIDRAYRIAAAQGGGCILVGTALNRSTDLTHIYIAQIDGEGDMVSLKIGSPVHGGWGWFGGVTESGDGGFVAVGTSTALHTGTPDMYLLKIDSEGSRIWEKIWQAIDIAETTTIVGSRDGGYLVTAVTRPDSNKMSVVYTLDPSGNEWVVEKTWRFVQGDAVSILPRSMMTAI